MTKCEVGLLDRLKAHSDYFDQKLDLIPVEHYFPKQHDENQWKLSRFAQNTRKNNAPKQAIKEATKKAKKAKLNPTSNLKSIPELQKIEALKEKEEKEHSNNNNNNNENNNNNNENKKEEEEEEEMEIEEQNNTRVVNEQNGIISSIHNNTSTNTNNYHNISNTTRTSLSELHQRLQARISQLRAKRKTSPEGTEPSDRPRKRQRREKEKPNSKIKKFKKKSSTTNEKENNNNNENENENENENPSNKISKTTSTSVFSTNKKDKEADIQFGTFDFSSGRPTPTYLLEKRKRMDKKSLLKKAEKELQNGVSENATWGKMLTKAKGEKVKDNPALLKKSIKREEQRKKRSRSQWEARENEQKKQKGLKQKKRNENIQEYLAKKKARRMGQPIKSPSKRPGFEGKKKKFINK